MVSKRYISFINPKCLKFGYGFNVKKMVLKKDQEESRRRKESYTFFFNRYMKFPVHQLGKRVNCYNGRDFFSFRVKENFWGSFVSNFIKTKQMGYNIHFKENKKKSKRKKLNELDLSYTIWYFFETSI